MFKRMFEFARRHKILTSIILIVVSLAVYYGYNSLKGTSSTTSYVLAAVEKGTLITSISGSGQVSVLSQYDVKPKVSGDITYLGVEKGQEIKAGAIIAQIDSSDAQKTIRDAQASLDSAKLSLEKLQQPTDELTLLQAENSLTQATESKQNYEDSLVKTYDDGFNTVSSAFLDLPDIMSGLQKMILGNDLNASQWNLEYYADGIKQYSDMALQYRDTAYADYNTARASYDKSFADYKVASRFSDTATVEALINEAYDTDKDIAQAIKSVNNLIQFYKDQLALRNLTPVTLVSTHLTSLSSYNSKINTQLAAILSAKNSIETGKQSIVSTQRSIDEKTASLAELKAGTDPLDIQSQELALTQKENALSDAKQKLADYTVRAPFDGVIADLNQAKGDAASSGTAIATIITKQSVAEISLNEVDAAKVKNDQKVTLTFDAIDGLSITGLVADMDTIGTVSQGVVSYDVKIVFDAQDERVKPGMSVSAAIITEAKTDVLLVPNSAVKTSGDIYYVLTLDTTQTQSAVSGSGVVSDVAPQQVQVEIGSANDTSTEITSGLKEGDQVVTKTVTSTTSQSSSSSFSLFGLFGGNSTKTSTTNSTTNTTRSSSSGSSSSGGEMGPPPGGF